MLLRNLSLELQIHWQLHLNQASKTLTTSKTVINTYLISQADLPNLKHPAYIHDWLEKPELRAFLEGLDG